MIMLLIPTTWSRNTMNTDMVPQIQRYAHTAVGLHFLPLLHITQHISSCHKTYQHYTPITNFCCLFCLSPNHLQMSAKCPKFCEQNVSKNWPKPLVTQMTLQSQFHFILEKLYKTELTCIQLEYSSMRIFLLHLHPWWPSSDRNINVQILASVLSWSLQAFTSYNDLMTTVIFNKKVSKSNNSQTLL